MKTLRITAIAAFLIVLGIFISAPSKYMQSFFDGVTVWAYNVLPAIFPSTVLTTLALKVRPKTKISFSKKLFCVDCDSVFIASLLCGYPIGAKIIGDSDASSLTATKACAFCSSAGPIFMIGTVGAKLLQNTTATVILIAVHFLSLIINGLIFRKSKSNGNIQFAQSLKPSDLGDVITDSALSVISVGGLIAIFYMLSDMIKSSLPIGIRDSLAVSFAIGIFEMTNGIFGVCAGTDLATATVLCSTLLSFGGLCVFAQCYAFLGKKQVKPLDIIKMKIVQSAVATILAFVFVKIFM